MEPLAGTEQRLAAGYFHTTPPRLSLRDPASVGGRMSRWVPRKTRGESEGLLRSQVETKPLFGSGEDVDEA